MTDASPSVPVRRERGVPWGLVALFGVAGIAHFVAPAFFDAIVPRWLPMSARTATLASGAAELAGAIGLVPRATRRAAGIGLIALLVAVFPANVQMLLDAIAADASPLWIAALVARLPLQPLMIRWVHRATRPRRRPLATTPP
jgi:uncharacterized membrane protein